MNAAAIAARWTPSRRAFFCSVGIAAAPATWALADPHPAAPEVSAEVAMARLAAGNARFVAGEPRRRHEGAEYRRTLANGQHPFAAVLACADSRVAPELIFDQGLGALFVIRVAGNVVDDVVLASIEYAVIHLRTNLVVVLGHERCGAVTAAADALAGHGSDADKGTKIGGLAALIAPAVSAVPASAADKVDAAVSINARNAAAQLVSGSGALKSRAQSGALMIAAARYSLESGRVTYLQGNPPAARHRPL